MATQSLATKNYGFLGAGNMTQAVISAWVGTGTIPAEKIYVSNRTEGKLQKLKETWGVHTVNTNEELVEKSDVILVAVKPQDYVPVIETLGSAFSLNHIVISFAAGIELTRLQKLLPQVTQIVRIMPNAAAKIQKGVIGYALAPGASGLGPFIELLFSSTGYVTEAEEGEPFRALTVGCSSGVGFVFELMIYWQEWLEERGFSPDIARALTVKTFLGASELADREPRVPFFDLQARVVSKKGVTAAGLHSMQELEIERLLRYSLEKADMRDQEIGRTSV